MELAKKITNQKEADRVARAAVRKELRDAGLLPQPKKPLNRKRFCEEAKQLLKEMDAFDTFAYIQWALMEMLGHRDKADFHLSKEAVGAAKVIKLAATRKEFEKRLLDEGRTEGYTVGELIDAVGWIFNL